MKANLGKFNYGSWDQGLGWHLSMEALSHATGLKLNHVPYKSIPQVITDMINGNLQVAFVDPFTPMLHIRSGEIRPLMISGHGEGRLSRMCPRLTALNMPLDQLGCDQAHRGWAPSIMPLSGRLAEAAPAF